MLLGGRDHAGMKEINIVDTLKFGEGNNPRRAGLAVGQWQVCGLGMKRMFRLLELRAPMQ